MARTHRYIPVIAAVAVLLGAQTSRGTSETAIQVAQPMVIEEGIFVSAATYSRYLGSHVAGYAVSLVSAPNCIVGEDGATQNRNAASIAGIGVTYDPFHNSGQLRGDTLCVRVDVSGLHPAPELRGWSLGGVVDATIESILLTASWHRLGWNPDRGRVDANFVRVEVLGSRAYADRGGTFGFKSLGELPRHRDFH